MGSGSEGIVSGSITLNWLLWAAFQSVLEEKTSNTCWKYLQKMAARPTSSDLIGVLNYLVRRSIRTRKTLSAAHHLVQPAPVPQGTGGHVQKCKEAPGDTVP